MTALRIALVVQGRFHAFDLGRELSRRGHEVTILTNYPAWAVRRFDVGGAGIVTMPAHGAMARAASRVPLRSAAHRAEQFLHRLFGRWAARALERQVWDVIHCWSGVSLELLSSPRVQAHSRLLMRGSAHIAVQDRLLVEEERRNGRPIDRPSLWMIERETREYALADGVVVLSGFAKQTFEAQGFPRARLHVLSLGVDSDAFRIPPALAAERDRRIRRGDPLRVLYAGALSFRKGLRDLLSIAALMTDVPCEFRLAGRQMPETAQALAAAGPKVKLLGHVPQAQLPAQYWDADVFLFPSIEDGFGVVLPQAQAAGLPVLATDHCAAPDLVEPGRNGWVFPIRSPESFAAQLRWCHDHRQAYAEIASDAAACFRPRTWAAAAADFEALAASSTFSRTREVSCS